MTVTITSSTLPISVPAEHGNETASTLSSSYTTSGLSLPTAAPTER